MKPDEKVIKYVISVAQFYNLRSAVIYRVIYAKEKLLMLRTLCGRCKDARTGKYIYNHERKDVHSVCTWLLQRNVVIDLFISTSFLFLSQQGVGFSCNEIGKGSVVLYFASLIYVELNVDVYET